MLVTPSQIGADFCGDAFSLLQRNAASYLGEKYQRTFTTLHNARHPKVQTFPLCFESDLLETDWGDFTLGSFLMKFTER